MSTSTATGYSPKVFAVAIPFLALLIVLLLSHTLLYQRLDNWLSDQQQSRVADEHQFLDVLFLDIDDESVHNLKADFSMWPYDRQIYGLVLDYLSDMGAETVVFDILFLEDRDGDDVFTKSIRRNGNAVFALRAPTYWSGFQIDLQKYEEVLADLSWPVSPDLPVSSKEMVLLPVMDFIDMERSEHNVGSVDVKSDRDGVVRRIPYIYKVGQSYIPSLPLVIQNLHKQQERVEYSKDQREIKIGSHSWPIDDQGLLHIYYPKNRDFLLSLSFHKVVRAAQGVFDPGDADHLFKGKTVFIGSTAFNSDKVLTPRGMLSGTYLLALIHQNLKHNLVLKPQSEFWDSLWVVLILATLLVNVFCRGYCPWKYGLIVFSSLGLIVYCNGWLFIVQKQPSGLLLPLLTGITGYILYVLFFGVLIKRQNSLLLEQKSELQLVNEALETKANTDALTGMLNRGAFLTLFEHEIERYKRTGVTFCVGIMDLDFFKKVNDTYGHDIGDDVLRNCAEILKKTKRELDVVARWGGEEFVIFFPETGIAGTQVALNKIRLAIGNMVTPIPDGELQVTMSIGMAEFNDLAMSPERCIAKADKALYQAKASGRNQVCVREK